MELWNHSFSKKEKSLETVPVKPTDPKIIEKPPVPTKESKSPTISKFVFWKKDTTVKKEEPKKEEPKKEDNKKIAPKVILPPIPKKEGTKSLMPPPPLGQTTKPSITIESGESHEHQVHGKLDVTENINRPTREKKKRPKTTKFDENILKNAEEERINKTNISFD